MPLSTQVAGMERASPLRCAHSRAATSNPVREVASAFAARRESKSRARGQVPRCVRTEMGRDSPNAGQATSTRCEREVTIASSDTPWQSLTRRVPTAAATGTSLLLLGDSGALAQGVPVGATEGIGGFNKFEVIVLFSPILVYGIFNLYRSKVNKNAKFSDLLFVIAAAVIVFNIFSIIAFKTRLF